ncbi:DNA-binding response regulator [Paractinoplanes deccanensis]|uniref:DNA-binding response regulator n=1 Tax=Paractinoplanes deccanensis TaxID=113561 RepID=A0ABQ3Y7P7_9ACTN|nr:response regulator transcription factor [Actinoplanes deccanensis]GID76004.1 DNA-binding response regulator [Actinoplanes deccanensis]
MAGVITEKRPIRLAIVDDDALVRGALRLLFSRQPDIEVVAEAENGIEAVAVAAANWPDIMLMDIRMPKLDGMLATQRIRSRPSAPQIIVLTTFNIDEYVVESLRGGASGFLLKDSAPQDIITAVRRVSAGESMLSPAVIRKVVDHVADPAAGSRRSKARAKLNVLTDREREVAICLGDGHSNAQIGATLRMSLPTVKGHVSRVMAKLELNNRVQVAILVHDAELL